MAEQGHNSTEELTPAERDRCRTFIQTLGFKTIIAGTAHPLTFAKTLIQLGHEPYPLTTGKSLLVYGSEAQFLPNVFQYLNYVRKEYGIKAFYKGVEANLISNATGAVVSFAATMYLDRYYPDVGGVPENVGKEEAQMSHHESARVKIRQAIRDSIAHSLGIIVARPFTVIMVREIAQHVDFNGKYSSVLSALLRIGAEEGPPGFFSGLIPELIAGLIAIWGVASVKYGVERVMESTFDKSDEIQQKAVKDTRSVMEIVIPIAINSLSYPFMVVSTVMALNGSCLSLSQLPHIPIFSHWSDAYNYLKPLKELSRGGRLFMRKYEGAITQDTIGSNLYASKKHFI